MNQNINKNKILEFLAPLIEESAKELNLQILEISFNKERGSYFLRVFIYNPAKPIDHKDCCNLSNNISSKIDDLDIMDFSYSLEVSSPGINRKLKNPIEYEVFKGKLVKVIMRKSLKTDSDIIIGKLIGLSNENNIIIEVDGTEKTLKIETVKTVQLEG